MRNLVTGGSGFLGSHLVDKLMEKGEKVISLDNFFTGNNLNNSKWLKNKNFELINHDIIQPITLEVDKIWHLACPASPVFYQKDPIKTAKTSFLGTLNMLGLAKKMNAKFLLASTSEVYGDPEVHPQSENYKGSVNPIGIRACYDEGKRIAETLSFDYHRRHEIDIRVMRIFNTYGPRMLPNDGRVVSNFIVQALKNQDLTIYGKGMQTRSFCYVDDLIDGMMQLMSSDIKGPVNIGNPEEYTIKQLAKIIVNKINPELKVIYKKLPVDDPMKRKPDINVAQQELGWHPKIKIDEGLNKTIDYFKNIL